ncbi:MAG: DUF3108 domain-containing protein [Burkholderiales bacterium]|nr:DUF3108 domain-containing protein [Burkholderiales bacterium]
MRPPWRESRGRRAAWFGLILAVLLVHALFGERLLSGVIGWNTAARQRRMDVTFAKRLQPVAPPPAVPAAAPVPAPAPRPARAVQAPRASSAPQAPERAASTPPSRAQLEDEALALADRIEAEQRAKEAAQPASAAPARAADVAAAASAAAAPASAVAGPARPPFAWPPATRLSYTLTGERGVGVHLYGNAVVEWRHEGSHYQVQFDVHISPMIDQHMYSEGEITAEGLSPRHYDESFSFLFATPRNRRVEFGDTEVRLDNGERVFKLRQTQDGASQFVQFVWMFYNNPEWLRPGVVVHVPLALPNNLRRWNYQVVGSERLDMAFGAVDAVHLKPLLDGPRRPNEYPFDIWMAPSLQYLPVQILVRVDEHTWALLALDDLPLQAAGERPPPPPPRSNPFPPPPPNGER